MSLTREQSKQQTRDRVSAVAAELILSNGFESTTIRDIAAAAGVSVGSVMAVGDKNALLVTAFDSIVGSFMALAPSTQPDGSCSEQIVTMVLPVVEIFAKHQGLARSYASILVSAKHESTLVSDLGVQLTADIAAILRDGQCVAADRIDALAEAIYYAYIGILFGWATRRQIDAEDLLLQIRRSISAICPCESGGSAETTGSRRHG